MVNILVSSASYLLTDHLLSSEGVFCYTLFSKLGKFGYRFEAISGQVKVKEPLKNVTFHEAASYILSPKSNLFVKYLTHSEFFIRSFLKSKQLLKTKDIDIIHHMLPAVYNQTFSPIAILNKGHCPFVMGPISAHIYPRPLDEKTIMGFTAVLHRKTIKKCARIITITNQVKKIYKKFFDENKIWTIPMAVDTQKFFPMKKEKEKEHYEILFVGSLYKLKGCEYLIKAIYNITQKRRDIKLRIIGSGPERKKLENLVRILNIKNYIIFDGFKPYEDMPRYYNNCDIFFFPTLGEPFGKVVIEAMACGKPVIASNVGGPIEILKNYETGILVPPARPDIYEKKILEILENHSLYKKLCINARKEVERKYSFEKIAEKYDKFYKEILNN